MYHVVIPNQVVGQVVNRTLTNSADSYECMGRKSFFLLRAKLSLGAVVSGTAVPSGHEETWLSSPKGVY